MFFINADLDIRDRCFPIEYVREASVQNVDTSNKDSLIMLDPDEYGELRFAAEFEKQEVVWLNWSFGEAKKGHPYNLVHCAIINGLAGSTKVNLLVYQQDDLDAVKKIVNDNCPVNDHVFYHVIPLSTIWIRDMGPNFLVNDQNKLVIAKFMFNQWGYDFEASPDELECIALDNQVCKSISDLRQLPILSSSIVGEGGNRELNGKGTMILVESVELARNPGKTIDELENEFKRVLRVKKIIWLKKGLYEDDITTDGVLPVSHEGKDVYTALATGGHIDEVCRFVGPNTILLAEVKESPSNDDGIAKENRIRLEENCRILENSTDQDGTPFTIIRIPTAENFYNEFEPGDLFYEYFLNLRFCANENFKQGRFPSQNQYSFVLSTSYMNFLISNDVVLIPTYWKEGYSEKCKEKDEEAFKVFQNVFPDKKIIPIDVTNINIAGGGIHCMTLPEPWVDPLSNSPQSKD